MKNEMGYYLVLGVVLVESCVTLGFLMSFLMSFFVSQQSLTEYGIDPGTLIGLRVVIGILFLEQAATTVLLAKGISKKHQLWLQIWIIIQFIHFVLTLIIIIVSIPGWIAMSGVLFNLQNIASAVYRLGILKIITDFREQIAKEAAAEIVPNHEIPSAAPQYRHPHAHPPVVRSGSKIISHV